MMCATTVVIVVTHRASLDDDATVAAVATLLLACKRQGDPSNKIRGGTGKWSAGGGNGDYSVRFVCV